MWSHRLPMRIELALPLALLVIASCSRDEDARKLLADMESFQENVEGAMRDSPDEAGVAKAEALVAAQSGVLRTRYADVSSGKLSSGTLVVIPTRCAGNAQAADVGRSYVQIGLAKANASADLRDRLMTRIDAMRATLATICGL